MSCDGTGGVRPTSSIKPTYRIHQRAYHLRLDAMIQARPGGEGKGAFLAPLNDARRLANSQALQALGSHLTAARRERRRLPLHLWAGPRGARAVSDKIAVRARQGVAATQPSGRRGLVDVDAAACCFWASEPKRWDARGYARRPAIVRYTAVDTQCGLITSCPNLPLDGQPAQAHLHQPVQGSA